MSISVETLGEDEDKFLVQVVSHSSKDGAKAGSKLVSILDCNLHTIEESRSEYVYEKMCLIYVINFYSTKCKMKICVKEPAFFICLSKIIAYFLCYCYSYISDK